MKFRERDQQATVRGTRYSARHVSHSYKHWRHVLERFRSHQPPVTPEDHDRQPPEQHVALISATVYSYTNSRSGSVAMTALVAERSLVVSDHEVAQAQKFAASIVSSQLPQGFDVVDEADRHVHVPAELAELVRTVLGAVASGASITIAAMPAELTTTVAARELGVSRPTLMKMIKDGQIDSHEVGSHTRLMTEDVQALRRRRRDAQRAAFDELRELEEAAGLEDN